MLLFTSFECQDDNADVNFIEDNFPFLTGTDDDQMDNDVNVVEDLGKVWKYAFTWSPLTVLVLGNLRGLGNSKKSHSICI